MKEQYCKDAGIELIVISHQRLDEIGEILGQVSLNNRIPYQV